MLTRRAFTAASFARVVSANDKIRFGVIGAGGISRADIKAFLLNQGTECVAICDVDDKQLAKRLESLNTDHGIKPETTKDYRRVVDRKDIDVCLVCTPDHWHALPAIYAVPGRQGRVWRSRWPPRWKRAARCARRYGEESRSCRWARSGGAGAHYNEAVEMVQSGKLGKVRQVRCWAYLDWVTDIGNPPDGRAAGGRGLRHVAGPGARAPVQPQPVPLQLPVVLGLCRRADDGLGRAPDQRRAWAMGPERPKAVISSGGKYALKTTRRRRTRRSRFMISRRTR